MSWDGEATPVARVSTGLEGGGRGGSPVPYSLRTVENILILHFIFNFHADDHENSQVFPPKLNHPQNFFWFPQSRVAIHPSASMPNRPTSSALMCSKSFHVASQYTHVFLSRHFFIFPQIYSLQKVYLKQILHATGVFSKSTPAHWFHFYLVQCTHNALTWALLETFFKMTSTNWNWPYQNLQRQLWCVNVPSTTILHIIWCHFH